MDREQQIAAIVAEARKQRRSTSRGLWVAAAVVGALCAIGFAIAVVSRGASGPADHAPAAATSSGFASGLGLGIAIGLVLGLAIARQVSHSSRSRP